MMRFHLLRWPQTARGDLGIRRAKHVVGVIGASGCASVNANVNAVRFASTKTEWYNVSNTRQRKRKHDPKRAKHEGSEQVSVSRSRTSLEVRNEYDNMITDWITTNWLTTDPKLQKKPCHFFFHDKLVYTKFDTFQSIYDTLLAVITATDSKAKINYETAKDLWNREMHTFNDKALDTSNRNMIESHLRTVLKSIFLRYLKNDNQAIESINKELQETKFQRKLLRHFKSVCAINTDIVDKVKNLHNLNVKNDFSIVKDRDWTFLPFINYNSLLKGVNRSNETVKSISVLDYVSILGNKMNDYKNLQKIQAALASGHKNNKFMIITNDREASLEYFRLIKLVTKTDPALKGCVVLLNNTSTEIDILAQFSPPKTYTGKELYYVVDKFNQIYDILEVL